MKKLMVALCLILVCIVPVYSETYDSNLSNDLTQWFIGQTEPMIFNACGFPSEKNPGFFMPWVYEYGNHYVIFEFINHRVFKVKYIFK